MKPLDECLFYLVREFGGLGAPAKDIYFDEALRHIREQEYTNLEMRDIEVKALVDAARRRNRLQELDEAVDAS